jgi:hypothetical protein
MIFFITLITAAVLAAVILIVLTLKKRAASQKNKKDPWVEHAIIRISTLSSKDYIFPKDDKHYRFVLNKK